MWMKMYMLVVVSLVLPCTTINAHFAWSNDWEFFTFTQSWPPGTCSEAVYEKHVCHIDPGIKTWTVHGLWPSVSSGDEPHYCNKSMKFDFSQIARLSEKLHLYWPNMYNDTEPDSFWEHEWEKHGTCATNLAATKDEYNFFATALELNQKYNLSSILAQSGVVPSEDTQYSYTDFLNAVKKVTGYQPNLQCSYIKQDDDTGMHLIYQIEICLDKTFKPISCEQKMRDKGSNPQEHRTRHKNLILDKTKGGVSCPTTDAFYYPPIKPV